MDALGHLENLGRIEREGVKASYVHLLVLAERHGLRTSCKTGKVPAVRMHDARDRYLFSCIPNQHHLLFYLRAPALEAAPELHGAAAELFPSVQKNPAGETTLRIETLSDAFRLSEWLFPLLPLR